jgi:O-methyltransferase involved in polyketide biosynthesis
LRALEKNLISRRSRRYTGMETKTARQILDAVHHTALAIASSRADLSDRGQELLYDKVFLSLLEENIHSMSANELLDVLAS